MMVDVECALPICPVCSAIMQFHGIRSNVGLLSGGEWFEWRCPKCNHVEKECIKHY